MKVKVKQEIDIKPVINICLKVEDSFRFELVDRKDKISLDHQGYVPEFMPPSFIEQDGEYESEFFDSDFLVLQIDPETGRILNWRKNAIELLANYIEEADDNV